MIPYACGVINKEDQKMFSQIEKIIENLEEVDLGEESGGRKILISCHLLAKALINFFPVEVHDGYFCQKPYSHSWLTTERSIIDVYPIAVIGGPILIDRTAGPLRRQYLEEELPETAFGNDINVFNQNVTKLIESIKETIEKINL